MSDPGKAVFLSYASQDAEAAKRIADALRAAGVEVWFDQNELVGGDAWDAKIRRQIAECALFVPVISANTQARREGYFRLEWRIAAQRTHMMSDQVAFLLPVVIDATRDAEADVPAEFKSVQWTRLPAGETPPAFGARLQRLLAGPVPAGAASGPLTAPAARPPLSSAGPRRLAVAVSLAVLAAGLFVWRPWQQAAPPPVPVAAPAPLSPAAVLEAKARALIDDDPLAVRENYKSAAELCERATQLSPDLAEAWATWARANCELLWNFNERSDRQVAALRSQAERALRLAPASIESALAMARYELQVLNDVKSARARLLAVLEKSPAERRAMRMLIDAEVDRRKDYAEARRWADRANALPGGDAEALVTLAWVYWGGNRLGDVRDTLARSLAIQPTTEGCQIQLMLLIIMGDFEGARRWLQQIPSAILREDRVAMVAYQGQIYAGDYAGAYQLINAVPREILEQGMLFAARGYLAGNALLLAGKRSAAEVEFRAALRAVDDRLALTPRDSRALYQRCLILARLKDTAEAERLLVTARELGGDDWADREALALLGRHEEALGVFDRVIQRNLSRWFTHLRDLKYDPIYAELRQLPRGREIIARGDRWLAESLQPGQDHATESTADEKSVAVLAFANLSDDKANEYFSDGISEELLNVLAKVPGLKVAARTSAFYFKGKEVPIPEIARQLGVAYVVEGSVRKAGDKVRITAQLIKAGDGFHVWSETFTRDLKDIFAVQDEIAGLIAKNLQLRLAVVSQAAVDPALYERLLEARAAAGRENNQDWRRAAALYQDIVARDPRSAVAWGELARVYVQLARFGGMSMGEGMREARRAAQQALELDPAQPIGHVALGWVQRTADWDWRGALQSFNRARELAPEDSAIMGDAAVLLFNIGRIDEAVRLARQGASLDPMNARAHVSLGYVLALAGRSEEALAPIRRSIELAPAIDEAHSHLARALLRLGRVDEAAQVAAQEPHEAYRWNVQSLVLAKQGRLEESNRIFDQFMAKYREEMPGYIAVSCAVRGQVNEAFEWLDRAVAARDSSIPWFKTNAYLDPLRSDPRWDKFLRKMGLADDQLK